MTAPTDRPEDQEEDGRLPWTAKMIRSTHFSRVGRGGRGGYEPAEVEAFLKRMVDEATRWEAERARLTTGWEAAREALRDRDAKGLSTAPPVMAISAVAAAQQQAERELGNARAFAQRIVNDARAAAQELARQARPAVAELPPAPNPTGDPVTDLEARTAHLQACQEILDGRARQLDEDGTALDEQRTRFVALLDRLEAAVPDVRAQLTAADPPTVEVPPAEVA